MLPALVVQVPDKASEAKLGEMLAVIESEWPGLGEHAIVHVFGEHEPVVIGSRTIRWVPAESIQSDGDIRVVLAKEAISTGWDCPRAEVLYSERPATDATHIAQVIGRMVRQPLAHRIATDDVLNSVACYLPLFDTTKVTAIKSELEGHGSAGQNEVGPRVMREPKTFERNTHLPVEVFAFVETLPSVPTPDPFASPLRRAKHLVHLLADDVSGKALEPDANAELTRKLNARLDGLAAEYAQNVAEGVADLRTASLRREGVDATGKSGNGGAVTTRHLETHIKDLDRDTNAIINAVPEGVGLGYYRHRVMGAGAGEDRMDIRVSVAALLRMDVTNNGIEACATEYVTDRLRRFAVDIKNTTGNTRDAYRRVQEQTSAPEAVTVALRDNDTAATKNADGEPLSAFTGHLFADGQGNYPCELNEWESAIIDTEIDRDSFFAWYRNPARPTPNALRIAYRSDAGEWASLQIDFLVISRRDDGTLGASIVDPHGDHLADARAKLHALADFAETHGNDFVRIVSVTKTPDGTLRELDLLDAATRDAVRAFDGAQVTSLYTSPVSAPFL